MKTLLLINSCKIYYTKLSVVLLCTCILSCSKNNKDLTGTTWYTHSMEIDCVNDFPYSDELFLADNNGCIVETGFDFGGGQTIFLSTGSSCMKLHFEDTSKGSITHESFGRLEKRVFQYRILENKYLEICITGFPDLDCIEFVFENDSISFPESIPIANQPECFINLVYREM